MQVITDKDNNAVTDSFNAVITELNRIYDDLKQSRLDAIVEDDDEKESMAKTSGIALKKFIQDVTDLSNQWNEGIFHPVKNEVATHSNNFNRRKAVPTRLCVTFGDKEIKDTFAVSTFVKALERLNFERIAKLDKWHVSNYPLVSKTQFNPAHNSHHKCGDWYINFPFSTDSKKRVLDEIGAELKIPIRVEIV